MQREKAVDPVKSALRTSSTASEYGGKTWCNLDSLARRSQQSWLRISMFAYPSALPLEWLLRLGRSGFMSRRAALARHVEGVSYPSKFDFGTAGSGSPATRLRTSSARKSANGTISSPTLALSSAVT